MPPNDAAIADAPRVVGAYLQTLLETAREAGVDPGALARAAGMPVAALDPAPDTLAATDYLRLLDAGAELCGDPDFGLHVGERMRLATYAVYGLIVLSCRTFGEAMAQVIRYEVLAHDLGRSEIRFSADGAEAMYVWHSAWCGDRPRRHLAESVTAGIRTFVDWMAGQAVPALEIGFRHGAPADLSEHERIFRCPLRFGAAENYARFSSEILGWPLANAEPSLFPVLVGHAERLLEAHDQARRVPAIVAEVKSVLLRNLAQDRTRLQHVAEELGVASRTLQRKLGDAGASYQTVLDAARREAAERYLVETTLSVTEIAFLIGYQEQSSFNHAFKGWTGLNPGAWRQRHAKSDL